MKRHFDWGVDDTSFPFAEIYGILMKLASSLRLESIYSGKTGNESIVLVCKGCKASQEKLKISTQMYDN